MHLDFVVAGFSKCGTTALCSLLAEHPNVFMPPRFKEPRFFNRPDFALYWNWYRDLFYTAPATALLGEGSVSYTESEFAEVCIQRLVKHFPKIKIILIARDPVDRVESSYREMHNSGTDWGIEAAFSIEEALQQMPNMLKDSRYWEITKLYQKYLPKEQLLVLFQEDLKVQSDKVLEQCYQFLKIDAHTTHNSDSKRLNQGQNKYYDTPKLRALRDSDQHPEAAQASYKILTSIENQFMPALNLRKPFGKTPHEWSPAAKALLLQSLRDGPEQFLSEFGKPLSFWPRYLAFTEQVS
ncbi:MAG: sulfotransferase [Bacteroidota bacterium]